MGLKEAKLLSPEAVMEQMIQAYHSHRGFSLIRLGDGEALALAQEVVLPWSEIQKRTFLPYAGLGRPNIAVRDQMVKAIRESDIVGVAMNELPDFTPLLEEAFKAHGLIPQEMTLTNACINYFILENGMLKDFLTGRNQPRVLLIGNPMAKLKGIMVHSGVQVTGAIWPVMGVGDWRRIAQEARKYPFDVALVSGGIAAVCICHGIAKGLGKIAIDFGHASNEIIKKKVF